MNKTELIKMLKETLPSHKKYGCVGYENIDEPDCEISIFFMEK
jgi:hypothetical protein